MLFKKSENFEEYLILKYRKANFSNRMRQK